MLSYVLRFFNFFLPSSLSSFIRSRFHPDRVQKEDSVGSRVDLSHPMVDICDHEITDYTIDQPIVSQADLMQAIQDENLERLEELLHLESINPNHRDKNGTLPLFAAIDKKNYAMVRALMRCERIDLSLRNGDGRKIGYTRLLGMLHHYIRFRSSRRLLAPLICNSGWMNSPIKKKDTKAHFSHLKSTRYLQQMSALFDLEESLKMIPSHLWGYNDFLENFVKDGMTSPDRMWTKLEEAWADVPDVPQHLEDAVQGLITNTQTGAITDAQRIADSVKNNQLVSFLLFRPEHVMGITIQGDMLIFTNLGGLVDLDTGVIGHNRSFTGKRIIHLDEKSKALFTADFIRSLQVCQPNALRKIFAMPVCGAISYPGQKRGNCVSSNSKSIWEDRLLLAQAQHVCADNPKSVFDTLFTHNSKKFHFYNIINTKFLPYVRLRHADKQISPINSWNELKNFMDQYGKDLPKRAFQIISKRIKRLEKIHYPVISHEDLVNSELKDAYRAFKSLTLKARQSALDDFIKDDYAIQFLSDQIKLNGVSDPNKAYEIATRVRESIIAKAESTIARMQQRLTEVSFDGI